MKRHFPDSIRRYAGIVLDIYYDHLLMSHWTDYSEPSSSNVFVSFYHELGQVEYQENNRFTRVKANLLKHQWLDSYVQERTCLDAMKSIESRFRHSANFAELAFQVIRKNEADLKESFKRFYPELMAMSLDIADDLKKEVAQRTAEQRSTC